MNSFKKKLSLFFVHSTANAFLSLSLLVLIFITMIHTHNLKSNYFTGFVMETIVVILSPSFHPAISQYFEHFKFINLVLMS